jgi:predicted RNase H-like nuclease (RuvC/YqgF family)
VTVTKNSMSNINDSAQLGMSGGTVLRLNEALTPILRRAEPARPSSSEREPARSNNLREALEIVARAANAIESLSNRNKELDAESNRKIAEFEGVVSSTQRENEALRLEVKNLRHMNSEITNRADLEIRELRLTVESQNKHANSLTDQLKESQEWLEFFDSQVRSLLSDAPAKANVALIPGKSEKSSLGRAIGDLRAYAIETKK